MLSAGVAAGIANGVVGGGTFITFPTFLAVNIPALQANVSSTVGVVPSYIGGIRAFGKELHHHRRILQGLIAWCGAGSAVGCGLLFVFPSSDFRAIVPWLIGAGTLVFAASPLITQRLAHISTDHPARRHVLRVGIFLAAIYGGYFGAGLGILLLAVMAVALPLPLRELQGLRNMLATIINLFAAVIFLWRGHLAWDAVSCILVGTFCGGFIGTALIQRLSPTVVRAITVAIGTFTTIKLAIS